MSVEDAKAWADAIDKCCEFGCGCFRINGQWARRCEAHRDGGKMHHFKDGLKGKDGNAVVPRGLLDEASAAYGKELKKRRGDPMAEQSAMISALKVAVEQCAERTAEEEKAIRERAAGMMAFPDTVRSHPGMTYRQWLVGQALAGVLAAGCGAYSPAVIEDMAKAVVSVADATLKELSK